MRQRIENIIITENEVQSNPSNKTLDQEISEILTGKQGWEEIFQLRRYPSYNTSCSSYQSGNTSKSPKLKDSTTPYSYDIAHPESYLYQTKGIIPNIKPYGAIQLKNKVRSRLKSKSKSKRKSKSTLTKEYNFKNTLNKYRYKIFDKIADTLQGKVYNGEKFNPKKNRKEKIVIKMTNRELYQKGITIKKGKEIKVQENIIQEKNAMMRLSKLSNNPPGFIKILKFFRDEKFFFMIQQHGGQDFFSYISGSHEKIKQGRIFLKEWKNHIKILFCQMVTFLKWLHHSNCCHLDISLENMLIQGVNYNDKNNKFETHGQVSFIDFGLAQFFENRESFYPCSKFVGKTPYKSPRVFSKKKFNAGLADVWSLGVCLFMMTVGCPPYQRPTLKDPNFMNLWNGFIKESLQDWKLFNYMPKQVLDLLNHIFTTEEKRYNIDDIANHIYVKKLI